MRVLQTGVLRETMEARITQFQPKSAETVKSTRKLKPEFGVRVNMSAN
jgi:hypothetical protein